MKIAVRIYKKSTTANTTRHDDGNTHAVNGLDDDAQVCKRVPFLSFSFLLHGGGGGGYAAGRCYCPHTFVSSFALEEASGGVHLETVHLQLFGLGETRLRQPLADILALVTLQL